MDVPAWRINAAIATRVIAEHNPTQPPVIDYEHQTLHKEANGQPAPAAGWIHGLRWLDGKGLYAEVELTQGQLVVRVRGGAGPYTGLLDGRPVAVGSPDPATQLPAAPGWATLSVIDATGRSARSGLRLIGPG